MKRVYKLLFGLALIGIAEYFRSLLPWRSDIDRMNHPTFTWMDFIEWVGWIIGLWQLFCIYNEPALRKERELKGPTSKEIYKRLLDEHKKKAK